MMQCAIRIAVGLMGFMCAAAPLTAAEAPPPPRGAAAPKTQPAAATRPAATQPNADDLKKRLADVETKLKVADGAERSALAAEKLRLRQQLKALEEPAAPAARPAAVAPIETAAPKAPAIDEADGLQPADRELVDSVRQNRLDILDRDMASLQSRIGKLPTGSPEKKEMADAIRDLRKERANWAAAPHVLILRQVILDFAEARVTYEQKAASGEAKLNEAKMAMRVGDINRQSWMAGAAEIDLNAAQEALRRTSRIRDLLLKFSPGVTKKEAAYLRTLRGNEGIAATLEEWFKV